MKLISLELLHRSMLSLRPPTDMQQFFLKMGAVEFHCLFSTRGDPFSLAMTSRGQQPEFFLFPISKQFEVSNSMSTVTFWRMVRVLRTTGESGNELNPIKFFSQMDTLIPRHATPARIPNPWEIMKLRPDILEERDKPWFSHWQRPGGVCKDGSPAKVSVENRDKTREFMGVDALKYSDINKISSHWSPVFVRHGWMPGK